MTCGLSNLLSIVENHLENVSKFISTWYSFVFLNWNANRQLGTKPFAVSAWHIMRRSLLPSGTFEDNFLVLSVYVLPTAWFAFSQVSYKNKDVVPIFNSIYMSKKSHLLKLYRVSPSELFFCWFFCTEPWNKSASLRLTTFFSSCYINFLYYTQIYIYDSWLKQLENHQCRL